MISISIDLVSPPHNLFLGEPVWTKYTVSFSALSAASAANSIDLFSLPARGIVHAVCIKHSASFTGGGLTNYTLAVGPTEGKYASAFNVFQAPGTSTALLTLGCWNEDFVSATQIKLWARASGGLLNAATAGSVDVWVYTSELPA
jgi:hypothetical protein